MTKNDKNFCLLNVISQESLFVVHMQKRKYLLIFFQFLIFGANSNKMTQMTKWPKMTEYCVVAPISQEAYTIWLWFLVHIYQLMTSSYAFYIFSKFWFSGLLGGKRAKNGPKGQKNLSVSLYLRNRTSYDCFLVYMCKMTSPAIFSFSQNSNFLGFQQGGGEG